MYVPASKAFLTAATGTTYEANADNASSINIATRFPKTTLPWLFRCVKSVAARLYVAALSAPMEFRYFVLAAFR